MLTLSHHSPHGNLSGVPFDIYAKVVYPFMVFNYESESYEYRKNSFMKFNPFEKNKHYKMLDETGFYRSILHNISMRGMTC